MLNISTALPGERLAHWPGDVEAEEGVWRDYYTALWFKRGMGPKNQGFIFGLFSTVCIDRLCQRESMMVTLSPGLKHQCTMEKSQQI